MEGAPWIKIQVRGCEEEACATREEYYQVLFCHANAISNGVA